jgi:hypothetical protein
MSTRVRLLLGLSCLIVVLAIGAPSASALSAFYRSGAYGTWQGWQVNNCAFSAQYLQTAGARLSRTASYPYSVQTISVIPKLEYSVNNGQSWYHYAWKSWESIKTYPGDPPAQFAAQYFDQLPAGRIYHVVMYAYWYAGGTKVGEVRYVFNSNGDYYNGTGSTYWGWITNGGCYYY